MNEDVRSLSCESDFDPNSLPVAEALSRISRVVSPIKQSQSLAIKDALNRVLATEVPSPVDVPNHTNSAMDGYAICHNDLNQAEHTELKVIGTAFAGHAFSGEINKGETVRIMTGAVMPTGCDTVIMQEHAQVIDDETIVVDSIHKKGQHVRYAGENLKQGQTALPAGRRLNPADIGLLASLGVQQVECVKRPIVAIIATGDEVKPLGQPLAHGEVYDSNRYTLNAMLTSLDLEVLDLGIIADDPKLTEQTFNQAAQRADAIIVSGGASVGEADFVRSTLNRLGEVSFWKLAMKPGRPLSFGKLDQAIFFGLPGNPVSVMVTYYQFVLPALKRLMGESEQAPKRFLVPCVSDLKKRPGRTEFQRGQLFYDNETLKVESTGQQGSGILSSMSKGDCFIILADDNSGIKAGELVEVQPFFGLM